MVSQAASLAAAELEFTEAGPVIVQRLETHLKEPEADSRGDLAACGLPLAPGDRLRLWGDYFSPCYGGGRWIPALGMLRYLRSQPRHCMQSSLPLGWRHADRRAQRKGGLMRR